MTRKFLSMIGRAFMQHLKRHSALILILTIIACITNQSCSRSKEPIKIGLAINLSGVNEKEGTWIRDAAQLAIDELNAQEDSNGQVFQLLVKEDGFSKESVISAEKELINEGVIAIIGHTTSSNTLLAEPFTASAKTLLLSPYAGTNKLSNKDDLFFRTTIDNAVYSKAFNALLHRREIKNVALLIDTTDTSLSEDYQNLSLKNFAGTLNEVQINTTALTEIKWPEVINALLKDNPQAVILLSGPEMTAIACQKLKTSNFSGDIITTIWSQTPDLLNDGTDAVDGITILTYVNPENKRPDFRRFANSLQQRYNTYPRAKSVRAYEAVHIIADALKRCPPRPTAQDLKKALLSEPFETLLGPLHFNSNGDVIRPLYIIRITNGRFHNAGEISFD